MAKRIGRQSGSRNRGYFYRVGRGWYTKADGRFVALEYENGDRMRDRDTPLADVKAAYKRSLSPEPTPCDGVTTLEVCTAYLAKVESEGAAATFASRQATLFDFCFGLSMKFIGDGKPKPAKSDYIHKGYGKLAVAELLPIHIDRWLQAHPKWKGGRRTKIQAVKRMLNYGVEAGLIAANPIKGYKTPKQNARATYLTPEQEQALCEAANPALVMAIKVCIRTGARPGCEFAKLTAKHVHDHGKRMEWVFKPDESKTKTLRIIRITDAEIIAIVRRQIKLYPAGPIFRSLNGGRWTRPNLTEKFRYTKNKLAMQFDDDCCMYSTRHTYAKRILSGYWSGKTTNIETLAILMGNSPQVCRAHYLTWCDHFAEPVWESA